MDTLDYHADPDDAIEVAATANVSLLVLTHMVPPRRNALLRRVARIGWGQGRRDNTSPELAEVLRNWRGQWVEAEDGMMFDLPAGAPSAEIRRGKVDV